MSVYVIAQLTFTDEKKYRQYQADFPPVFRHSGGRAVVADEAPKVLEGKWSGDKVVILEFPTEEQATEFLSSPDYEAIAVNRKAGADTVSLLVAGLPA